MAKAPVTWTDLQTHLGKVCIYESFYKNEGICEEKKQKNNIAYFDSFSFKTEL